jgi:hypothetical protein
MKPIIRIHLLVVFCLSNSCLIAQINAVDSLPVGPFLYTPPEGIERYSNSTPTGYINISMDKLSPLTSTDNGLMVALDIDLDLKEDEDKPIISFSNDGSENNLIEIRYSERTVTVKRYNIVNGNRVSYDYRLFDPLFKDTTGIVTWRMKVYFTSSFMYIVTRVKGSLYKYMSPVYFGLDNHEKYPDINSVMYRFINRDIMACIALGSLADGAPLINNIIINSFVYSNPSAPDDWWRTMQREFASPNPPTSNN